MVAQVVLKVRVLLVRMEQNDFMALFFRQVFGRVISMLILPLDLTKDLPHSVLLRRSQLIKISLIVEPLGFQRVTISEVTTVPEELTFSHILLGHFRLLQNVVLGLEVLGICFGIEHKLIEHAADILDGRLLVDMFEEALSDTVAIRSKVHVIVHELHPSLHLLIVHLCVGQVMVKLLGRNLNLGELLVEIVVPLSSDVLELNLVNAQFLS